MSLNFLVIPICNIYYISIYFSYCKIKVSYFLRIVHVFMLYPFFHEYYLVHTLCHAVYQNSEKEINGDLKPQEAYLLTRGPMHEILTRVGLQSPGDCLCPHSHSFVWKVFLEVIQRKVIQKGIRMVVRLFGNSVNLHIMLLFLQITIDTLRDIDNIFFPFLFDKLSIY